MCAADAIITLAISRWAISGWLVFGGRVIMVDCWTNIADFTFQRVSIESRVTKYFYIDCQLISIALLVFNHSFINFYHDRKSIQWQCVNHLYSNIHLRIWLHGSAYFSPHLMPDYLAVISLFRFGWLICIFTKPYNCFVTANKFETTSHQVVVGHRFSAAISRLFACYFSLQSDCKNRIAVWPTKGGMDLDVVKTNRSDLRSSI